jgi:colicin import membrane protein
MTDATPYTVPKEPGRWRAITLAALVHIALVAFLWIGIRWQSETPITVEAEVWSPEIREAAPPPQPTTEPEPKPVVKETPKPEVKEPPVVKPEPPVAKPDIALEQEKKRKAEEERLAKQKAEEEKLAKLKKEEEEKLKKQKKEEEEKLAKKKAEEKLQKEAQAKKAADEKKRKEEEADEKLLAKARDEEMRRITGVAGTGGAGDAPKSQGPRGDPSYAQRVGAKIKSNINFNVADDMAGNQAVEYEVQLLPDGSVGGMRKIKSSGVPGFDEAVRRAIEKAQPYPKDKSGAVPSSFIGIHRPKDQ